jgi:hypothetical protein
VGTVRARDLIEPIEVSAAGQRARDAETEGVEPGVDSAAAAETKVV